MTFLSKKQFSIYVIFALTLLTVTAMAGSDESKNVNAQVGTSYISTTSTTEVTNETYLPTTSSSTSTSTTTNSTSTTIVKTPEEEVNAITYIHSDPEPAMTAFVIVATARGWSAAQIDEWYAFAKNVMYKESKYCYNVKRGAIIAEKVGCVLQKQGPYQDSGFAQLIRLHYDPGKWLCTQELLCSSEDIISTPWNSMTAFIALLERNGRQPWCYTDSLRALTRCKSAPKNPPAV